MTTPQASTAPFAPLLPVPCSLLAPPPSSRLPSPPRVLSRPFPIFSLPFSILLLLLPAFLSACTTTHPLRGGRALTSGPVHQTLLQSDNPSQPSRQDQETIRTRTYTLPAGTLVQQPPTISPIPSYSSHPVSTTPSLHHSNSPAAFLLPAPMPVTEREETRARTELGAAQKDTARELGAKLSSLKGIVWVGVGLFIFGLATIFWAPLRVVIGSLTTSIAITLGGVALMVLPTLIVGNELLILGGVALAVGGWFLAHRHGELRGQVAATKRTASDQKTTSSITIK